MDKIYLSVLKNVADDELFQSFTQAFESDEKFNNFLHLLFESGFEENFTSYVDELILSDDNAFSRLCAAKKRPSEFLSDAFLRDVTAIYNMLERTDTRGRFAMGEHTFPLCSSPSKTSENLADFYASHGFGKYIRNAAFVFDGSKLVPVGNADLVRLEKLKDYRDEKRLIEENITAFLSGLPYSHTLLYGDRGTGKSSTVRAMLGKYFAKGLRLVELNGENLLQLPKIRELLYGNPLKFLIFVDDLSLSQYDKSVSVLKACLEGSVAGGSSNAMVIATSNRRHIVSENLSDRENAVHAKEALDEQLSLSDRFGLTVLFSSTDKESYISIVRQLAADARLKTDELKIISLAERWALVKGGRSPRRAKQFIDFMIAAEAKGAEPEF